MKEDESLEKFVEENEGMLKQYAEHGECEITRAMSLSILEAVKSKE